MNRIILCNRLKGLGKSLKDVKGPLRFISLVDTKESREICTLLQARPGAKELPRTELFRERSWEFRTKYIAFLGQLNIQNHSLEWWAMPFTNKNPAATTLCRNTFYFLLVAELSGNDSTDLLVISDSVDLAAQIKSWAQETGIQVKNLIRTPDRPRAILKRYTPAGIIRSVARTFFIWTRARRYRPVPNSKDEHIVVASITHPRSFAAPGVYRDAYFGPLVESLNGSNRKALVLAMLLEQPIDQLRKLQSVDSGIPVVPLEACFTLRDFAACTWRSLRAFFLPVSLRGQVTIDGLDISSLVKRAIRDTRHSGDIFMSLRVHYCGRWLARNLKVTRCLYPYENRSWEKMLIQGMRSSSPQTQMVGYQHAAITPSETNYILADGEGEIIPLPNCILTTGAVAGQWLEKEGNYPLGMFKNACALRQGQPAQVAKKARNSGLPQIFVALGLGAGTEEYLLTLTFLEAAFADESGYSVRIRAHPQISLDSAWETVPLEKWGGFTVSTGTLTEDLEWADVALYASSTVGLEAVALGIPGIHLNLGDFLDNDPMLGWEEFNWSVEEPNQLVDTIKEIASLPEDEFLARQKNGQEYAAAYLEPVTARGLQRFLG